MRLILSALLLSALTSAQTFQGSLRGRVLDPTGAAVRTANLSLTDEATLVSRSTITNDDGEYIFSAVTPSTYTVTVEAAGFKTIERHGVAIATQASVTLDLGLEVGQVSEQVNVTADAPLLEAANGSTGQEINTQKITDLPLLGRNPFLTGKLAQTVVFAGNPRPERQFTGFHCGRPHAHQQLPGGRYLDHRFQQPCRYSSVSGSR